MLMERMFSCIGDIMKTKSVSRIPKTSTIFLVHPFFSMPDCYRGILPAEYIGNIENLVASHGGNIVVLEEGRSLEQTKSKISSTDSSSKISFVETLFCSPRPKEMGWDDLIKTFNLNHKETIYLGGGFLARKYKINFPPIKVQYLDGPPYEECLGETANMLSDAKIPYKFIRGCVFSYNPKIEKAVICDWV